MTNAYAVIMAGGSGTRFWPASRRDRPKQLLPLGRGKDSLLRQTVDRIAPLVPAERVLVVTSAILADATAAELPDVPRANILVEPVGRNTAPCVGWAAAHVRRRDAKASMMVLPADHHIGDEEAYRTALSRALAACAEGELVTIGLHPDRPETGYGYLELGPEIAAGVHEARRFVEKPNLQRAEQFLASGGFLWNSGMFFFRADAILEAIDEHLPGLAEGLRAFDEAAAVGDEASVVAERYATLPAVSIDHGIMEKADRVAVVPAEFQWSDLGTWTTAWELADRDGDGNAGEAIYIDARSNLVRAPASKLVALIGLDDLVVIDTDDALLVMPRDRAQDVRDIVAALAERDDDRR